MRRPRDRVVAQFVLPPFGRGTRSPRSVPFKTLAQREAGQTEPRPTSVAAQIQRGHQTMSVDFDVPESWPEEQPERGPASRPEDTPEPTAAAAAAPPVAAVPVPAAAAAPPVAAVPIPATAAASAWSLAQRIAFRF